MQIRKIKGARLAPATSVAYFRTNPAKWTKLNEGEAVTIPEKEWPDVEKRFGTVVIATKESVSAPVVKKTKKIEDKL